ncbi:MAG: SulP family inorganic anion transporter, partial [Actinomycetota bacterium]
TGGMLATVSAGIVIGIVEVVLAISFAALVFGGYLDQALPKGIGIYLVAASMTLAILAWRAGVRGVVGSVQDAAAAVLAIVAASAALDTFGGVDQAFLTVVAATVVVTILTAVTFLLLGTFKLGNLARFIPYPVVGGFLAGTGLLLFKGGLRVAASLDLQWRTIHQFVDPFELVRWGPAVAFGVILLIATRVVRRPLVIPAVLGLGLIAFAVGMLVTGSSIESAQDGLWLLGPFLSTRLWQLWTIDALRGADWSAVVGQAPGIATTVFVAVMACLFNVGGVELLLHTDLDSNEELRDAGLVNVATGLFGGIPGYHALSLTALAEQMDVDGRGAGLVAALVPLTAVVFGAGVVGLIPRMIVGGVLVFVGLSFLVTWLVDMRRSLPVGEYLIVVSIVATIATKGLMTGLVVGLILAVVLFAVNYGRIDLVRDVTFGTTYRSNVERPPAEREILHGVVDRVQILRLSGFVFFGTANGFLERIRKRVEGGPIRFLLVDLRRVTGVDASGVLSFRKVAQLAEASGFELVLAGASERVQGQLGRGGVGASEAIVRFEPDLDRGLQRCEDVLLAEVGPAAAGGASERLADLPPHLAAYLERRSLPEGTVLIRQGDQPHDMFVLESGRLRVELTTPEGARVRLSSVRPGVVVGEVALYTGVPRTADVVAETPCVVLGLTRTSIERLESEEPETAAALHRWLAATLAVRLTDSDRAYAALLD